MPNSDPVLITGGHIATVDANDTVLTDGYLLVRDGRIAEMGRACDAPRQVDCSIDARGCLVTPGLINTHQHLWYNLLKCLSDGMLLEPRGRALSRPATAALLTSDIESSAYLAGLEMLGSGTSTFLNHSVTATDEVLIDAQVRPTAELGMRQVFAKELYPKPSVEESLGFAEQIHSQWSGRYDGRVGIGLVIETTAHWVAAGASTEELILAGNELADRLGVRVTGHLAGGTMSRDQGYLKFVVETGRTEVEYLNRIGVLDRKWVLGHVINATSRDIRLLAESGASVSHTPTAEASRGGGITPVQQMLDAGVLVSLGSDGPNVDTSVDIVEQMKLTLLLQNQLASSRVLDARRTLRMATADAARALGMDDQIGSLEVGKLADIAVFDMSEPHTAVCHDPITLFVHSLRGRDVRDLIVNGDIVIRNHAFAKLADSDIAAILSDATGRARALVERAGVRNPRWGAADQGHPHLEASHA